MIIAALAAAGGWWAASHFAHSHEAETATSANGGRTIRFYQCSMHPQVTSDKPGKCTICGMQLSPIFEGQNALDENLIALTPNAVTVVNVQAEEVKRRPLQRTLRVAGTIDDNDAERRILSAYIEGRIDKLFVNFVGAEVKKGEMLATFYSPMLLTAQREYQLLASRLSTNAGALQTENQRLLESTAQRLLQLGLTREQIDALREQTNSTFQSEILAPVSGTVVARHVYEGQYVKEGDKLFEIADFSTMWFQFDAYERDLPWLQIGQQIQVTTPAMPDKSYAAKINFIDPNINNPTRSARVRVEIPNPLVERDGKQSRELLHKLYGEAQVKMSLPETLVVPRTAILNGGGDPVVYVEKESGSYEQRKVKLGRMGDDHWEILDGVADGEKVVTRGNMLIDAQSQLNQGGAGGGMAEMPGMETTKASTHAAHEMAQLTETQQGVAREFFSVAGAVAKALAADDLKAFNDVSKKLPANLEQFQAAFARRKGVGASGRINRQERSLEKCDRSGRGAQTVFTLQQRHGRLREDVPGLRRETGEHENLSLSHGQPGCPGGVQERLLGANGRAVAKSILRRGNARMRKRGEAVRYVTVAAFVRTRLVNFLRNRNRARWEINQPRSDERSHKHMIRHLISWSLRNRFLVLCGALFIIAFGVRALYTTPVDAIPDLSENQVIVFADWAGRSPQEVEDQITYPLSVNLQGLGRRENRARQLPCSASRSSRLFSRTKLIIISRAPAFSNGSITSATFCPAA